MEQILRVYVTAKMMLNKNMTVMIRSHDGDSKFFDIVTGILQGAALDYIYL